MTHRGRVGAPLARRLVRPIVLTLLALPGAADAQRMRDSLGVAAERDGGETKRPDGVGFAGEARTCIEVQDDSPLKPDSERGDALAYHRVRSQDARAFTSAIRNLRAERRRDGTRRRALLRDIDDDRVRIERFESLTWLEHLRQFRRGTVGDEEVQDRVRGFHSGDEPPVIRHLLGQSALALADDRQIATAMAAAVDPHLPGASAEPASGAPPPGAGAEPGPAASNGKGMDG